MFIKKLFSCFKKSLYILALTSVSITTAAYQKLDKTIAVIDDDVIFLSELDKRFAAAKFRLKDKEKVNEKKLKKRLLEGLILETIQLNIAKKNNIQASKTDVERAIAITESNLKRSGLTLETYLKSQNISGEEFILGLKKEIVVKKMQQAAVNQRITVTEKEIDNFLESKAGQEWLTPRFRLGHIFLPLTDANKKQADKIYQQLQNPKNNFAFIAQKYSKGPNASKGGDLGIQTKEDMPELFTTKVDTLRVGEITPPFTSAAGIHILKLVTRHGAEPVIVTQYKVRHILSKPSKLFTAEEAKTKIAGLYQRIIAGESFEALAAEHTDDIGSKLGGGDLGWSSPGVFVQQFEKMMQSTPVGQVSEPFTSQFGWHILKVDDIRQKDVFDSVKRQEVTRLLKRQRFQDELQIWLKELRESVFVEKFI